MTIPFLSNSCLITNRKLSDGFSSHHPCHIDFFTKKHAVRRLHATDEIVGEEVLKYPQSLA